MTRPDASSGNDAGDEINSSSSSSNKPPNLVLTKPVPPHLLPSLASDCTLVVSRLVAMVAPSDLVVASQTGPSLPSPLLGGEEGQGRNCNPPKPPWKDPFAWAWAIPVPLLLMSGWSSKFGAVQQRRGEDWCVDEPHFPVPIPSPIINSHAVARILLGLATPLCSAKEWRSSCGEAGGLWGKWVGWEFAGINRVAARVVKAYGEGR